jgi:hypothetical protein
MKNPKERGEARYISIAAKSTYPSDNAMDAFQKTGGGGYSTALVVPIVDVAGE